MSNYGNIGNIMIMGNIAELNIIRRKISEVKPNPRNPRLHNPAQLEKLEQSLVKYGYAKGSMVVNSDGYLLCGHGMYAALKEKGYTEADFVEVDMSEGDALAFLIADNRLGELSSWDDALLAADLAELAEMPDAELEDTGFELDEIADFMGDNSVTEDDFDVGAALEEEPVTQVGDLWHLSNHRLLCGDSTQPEDVERVMGGEKAVLMATDPPYGDSWVQKAKDMAEQGYGHSRAGLHGYIESDDLSESDLKSFLDSFLSAARLAGDPPFPLYVWHGAKRIIFEQALVDAGYLVHQPVIWVKPSFVIGRLHYHPRCEWALHGWLPGNGKCSFYGERNQSDVWELNRENEGLHPTQKPVELFAIPMRNHTKIGDICYEPFAGSGTQYISAVQLDRVVFGLELEPRYCDVTGKRYINHVGTDEDVFVERDGKKFHWSEVNKE